MYGGLKTVGAVIAFLLGVILILAAYSHRIVPVGIDQCQQIIRHQGPVADLPAFHCFAHRERDMGKADWDQLHPWMTESWRAEHDGPEIGHEN